MNDPAPIMVEVAAVDCILDQTSWAFALDRSADIDAHWAEAVVRQPSLFNGRVLLQTRGAAARGTDGRMVFRAAYTEVDFKAFLAWRDFGFPVQGLRNGFGMAALQSADGAFILGEMSPSTANAGLIYFPSGTPDPSDIVGNRVDLPGSIRRELAEETALDVTGLTFQDGFTIIDDRTRVCIMQRVTSPDPASIVVERIHAALAAQSNPELVRMHVVRSMADLNDRMPAFLTAYLRRALELSKSAEVSRGNRGGASTR